MSALDNSPNQRALWRAVVLSLVIHAAFLLVPRHDPAGDAARPHLQARLPAHRPPLPVEVPRAAARGVKKQAAQARLLTTNKASRHLVAAPQWSAAEKADMNSFLDELADQAKSKPMPTLAQRSFAMAHELGREAARQDENATASLELKANAAPPDRFSLDLYVDGLIKRLNRHAAFVRNDPRSKGMRPAAVQFRLNPDGTLKTFVVLNLGDQAEEVAFIKMVIEHASPFSPFPADINQAAHSLAMTICILPGTGDGGFGFSRSTGGRGC